jgi:hypothetical protein
MQKHKHSSVDGQRVEGDGSICGAIARFWPKTLAKHADQNQWVNPTGLQHQVSG